MSAPLVPNTVLKLEKNQLLSVQYVSRAPTRVITQKSWLILLELFAHQNNIPEVFLQCQGILAKKEALKAARDFVQKQPWYPDIAQSPVMVQNRQVILVHPRGNIDLRASAQKYPLLLSAIFHDVANLKNDEDSLRDEPTFLSIVGVLKKEGFLAPAPGTIQWGDVRRLNAFCLQMGFARGTPIDRYYLNRFVEEACKDIRGKVLEIGGKLSNRERYGLKNVTEYHALDIRKGPDVDMVGDAANPDLFAESSWDTVIMFNVLEHAPTPWEIVKNVHRWLRAGGSVFALVPNAQRLHSFPGDYWRPLPDAMEWMFERFSKKQLFVYGNPLTVIASLLGVAAEELTGEELNIKHPDFPVATGVAAIK